MIAVEFPEVNIRLGENQPEYLTLPAFHNKEDGSFTFCFQLNAEEIEEINRTGNVYFRQLAFGKPLQPVMMSTQKEDLI